MLRNLLWKISLFKEQSVTWCVLEPTHHEHALHGGEEGEEHQGQRQRVEDERLGCDGLEASRIYVAELFADVGADRVGLHCWKDHQAKGEFNEDRR